MNPFKRYFIDYLLVNFETTLAIGIIGIFFCNNITIGFDCFFLPPLFSIIGMLGCIPLYFMENLTINQVKLYRVLDFIFLEFAIEGLVYVVFKQQAQREVYIFTGIFTFVNCVLTYLISDQLYRKDVKVVNEKLILLNNQDEDDNEPDTI